MLYFFLTYGLPLLTGIAHAQPSRTNAIGIVGGSLSIGAAHPAVLTGRIGAEVASILNVVAILIIATSGAMLLFNPNEERLGKTKKTLIGAFSAIVVVNMALVISAAFSLPATNSYDQSAVTAALQAVGNILESETLGFISWVEVPVLVLCILMIVVSGIRAVTDYSSEKGIGHLKNTIIANSFGILLILFRGDIGNLFIFVRNPDTSTMFGSIIFLLGMIFGIVALIAVAILIYAGILMIVNVGDDDQYGKAKSLAVRVLIGIFMLTISVALGGVVLDLLS